MHLYFLSTWQHWPPYLRISISSSSSSSILAACNSVRFIVSLHFSYAFVFCFSAATLFSLLVSFCHNFRRNILLFLQCVIQSLTSFFLFISLHFLYFYVYLFCLCGNTVFLICIFLSHIIRGNIFLFLSLVLGSRQLSGNTFFPLSYVFSFSPRNNIAFFYFFFILLILSVLYLQRCNNTFLFSFLSFAWFSLINCKAFFFSCLCLNFIYFLLPSVRIWMFA